MVLCCMYIIHCHTTTVTHPPLTHLHIAAHLQVHPLHHPRLQLGPQSPILVLPCLSSREVGIECNMDGRPWCGIVCGNVLERPDCVKCRPRLPPTTHQQAACGAFLWRLVLGEPMEECHQVGGTGIRGRTGWVLVFERVVAADVVHVGCQQCSNILEQRLLFCLWYVACGMKPWVATQGRRLAVHTLLVRLMRVVRACWWSQGMTWVLSCADDLKNSSSLKSDVCM